MTDWIEALREACAESSQKKIGKELGVSATTINLCLKGTYIGRTDRIEELVRGKYMNETVNCPLLAEITKDKCLEEQNRDFSGNSPLRVKLFKACQNCKHNKNRG